MPVQNIELAKDPNQNDSIEGLANDNIVSVFEYLTQEELAIAAQVSKRFHQLSKHERLKSNTGHPQLDYQLPIENNHDFVLADKDPKKPKVLVTAMTHLQSGEILCAYSDNTIKLIDPKAKKSEQIKKSIINPVETRDDKVTALTVLADGRYVSGTNAGMIYIWNRTLTEAEVIIADNAGTKIVGLDTLKAGYFVSAAQAGYLRLYDSNGSVIDALNTDKTAMQLNLHVRPRLQSMQVIPASQLIRAVGSQQELIWNPTTNEQTVLNRSGSFAEAFLPSANGGRACVFSTNQATIQIKNAAGNVVKALHHSADITHVSVSHSGRIVIADENGDIKLFSFAKKLPHVSHKDEYLKLYNREIQFRVWAKIAICILAVILTPLSLFFSIPIYKRWRDNQKIQLIQTTQDELMEVKKKRENWKLHVRKENNGAIKTHIQGKPRKERTSVPEKPYVKFLADREQRRRFEFFRTHDQAYINAHFTQEDLVKSKRAGRDIIEKAFPVKGNARP